MPDWSLLIISGSLLIMLGFLLILVGILHVNGSKNEADIKGGGVLFVGPVPIIFGSDKRSAIIIMLLAIALMLLLIILNK